MFHQLLIVWTLAPRITGKFRQLVWSRVWDAVFSPSAFRMNEFSYRFLLIFSWCFFRWNRVVKRIHQQWIFSALRQVPDSTLRRLKRENGGPFFREISGNGTGMVRIGVANFLWAERERNFVIYMNIFRYRRWLWLQKEAIMFLEAAAFWRQPQCIKCRCFKSRLRCVLLL